MLLKIADYLYDRYRNKWESARSVLAPSFTKKWVSETLMKSLLCSSDMFAHRCTWVESGAAAWQLTPHTAACVRNFVAQQSTSYNCYLTSTALPWSGSCRHLSVPSPQGSLQGHTFLRYTRHSTTGDICASEKKSPLTHSSRFISDALRVIKIFCFMLPFIELFRLTLYNEHYYQLF